MADQGAALPGFSVLEYHPGNPQFPTLPVDPAAVKLMEYGVTVAGIDFSSAADRAPAQSSEARPLASLGAGIALNADGFGASGFADWYLETLWLSPEEADFGDITDEKDVFVTAHNTHRVNQSLDSKDFTLVDGLSLPDPGLPISIGPFASQVLTLRVTAAGPDSFDEEVTFTFSIEGAVPYRVLGRRVLFFSTFPQSAMREQLSWLTKIARSKDGTEKVMALRLAPRAKVKLNIKFTNDVERTTLTNILFGGSPLLAIGFQLWWEAETLTDVVSSTATVVPLDTTRGSWAIGNTVSMVLPDRTKVEGEIETLSPTQIVFTNVIGVELPAGTSVMPVRFGRFTGAVKHGVYPVNLEEMAVEWSNFDEEYLGAIDATEFPPHPIDGLPILTKRWILGDKAQASTKRETTDIDGETGIVATRGSEALAQYETNVEIPLNSKDEIFKYRQFLHAMYGSWGKFYLPTFQRDLVLFSQLVLGGNTVVVEWTGMKNMLAGLVPKRDLRIVTEDGTVYYRRITNIVDNVVSETITVDSTIGSAGNSSIDATVISWMHTSRINGDSATLQHKYSGRADLKMSVRSVKE